jgi:hypothetical protein
MFDINQYHSLGGVSNMEYDLTSSLCMFGVLDHSFREA